MTSSRYIRIGDERNPDCLLQTHWTTAFIEPSDGWANSYLRKQEISLSRANYNDDCDGWQLIMWRGAVASAIRGKRGQAFLKEMLAALDALPEKCLIAEELERDGEVCAIGSVGKARGVDMSKLDPEESSSIAKTFGIADALVREIEYINDEWADYNVTPERRYEIVRNWVVKAIRAEPTA